MISIGLCKVASKAHEQLTKRDNRPRNIIHTVLTVKWLIENTVFVKYITLRVRYVEWLLVIYLFVTEAEIVKNI